MESALQHQWQQLNPEDQPPAYRGSNLVFDKKRQQGVLLARGETWLWQGSSWRKAASKRNPPARNTTHLVYDVLTEGVLLFGGVGLDGTPLNDVWLWNGSAWTEQHPAQRPLPLGSAAMACDTGRQQVLLFGGVSGFDGSNGSNRVGTFSQSTWIWDGSTWTEQNSLNAPAARAGGLLVYDEGRQQMLLYGGYGAAGYLQDMWLWQGQSWQAVFPTTLPPARARYRAIFHERLQQVVLLAELLGEAEASQRVYQTWTWDGTNWSLYAPAQTLPGSVEGFAYDNLRHTSVACLVTGGKARLANKQTSTGAALPALAAPALTSETWTW